MGVGNEKPSYSLCRLLASTLTILLLYHVKDCKQANTNSAQETSQRAAHALLLQRSLCLHWGRKKHLFYCQFKLYISVLYREKGCIGIYCNIVSGQAKHLWHMPFTGCVGTITVIYDKTSHYGLSFLKWYTAIHQWILTCAISLLNKGHVSAVQRQIVINDWHSFWWVNMWQDVYKHVVTLSTNLLQWKHICGS